MSEMIYAIATWHWEGWQNCVDSWRSTASRPYPKCVVFGLPILEAYQQIFEHTAEPILSWMHDDLMIYEPNWDRRVLREFDDPAVGLVGFAGALGHGQPELYQVPFHLPNLVRIGFRSNLRQAEAHGERFAGACDVAVLDGLALFVRRCVLEKVGGWPVDQPVGYWMYAEWLCCETRRQGYRIRLVGVDCEHLGGKTASMTNVTDNYEAAHRYFYENNRDVMPFQAGGER